MSVVWQILGILSPVANFLACTFGGDRTPRNTVVHQWQPTKREGKENHDNITDELFGQGRGRPMQETIHHNTNGQVYFS
jgi:hypothetical protein